MQAEEAKDPQWVSMSDLKKMVEEQPEKIFSLQYATLKKYLAERA